MNESLNHSLRQFIQKHRFMHYWYERLSLWITCIIRSTDFFKEMIDSLTKQVTVCINESLLCSLKLIVQNTDPPFVALCINVYL